jgi:hypothetical protein
VRGVQDAAPKWRQRGVRSSISDYLLSELEDLASRPTPEEMRERLEARSRVLEGEGSVEAVRAGRRER